MKTTVSLPSALRRGFTMIELLVVITIIAILAGLVFSVGPSVINNARKVQAKAAMSDLEIAVTNYMTDYNRLPNPDNATNDTTLRSQEKLLNILTATSGVGNTNNEKNPRKTSYFEPKITSSGKGGVLSLATATAAKGSLVDPWGMEYYLRFDYDYDDSISTDATMPLPTGHTGPLRPKKLAIWSGGKDKSPGGANQKDDVASYY